MQQPGKKKEKKEIKEQREEVQVTLCFTNARLQQLRRLVVDELWIAFLRSSSSPHRELQAINGKTQALARQSIMMRESNTAVEGVQLSSLIQVISGLMVKFPFASVPHFACRRRTKPYRWWLWA